MKTKFTRRVAAIGWGSAFAGLLALGSISDARATVARFDFGPADSAVWPGFQRVTASTRYEPGGFGWRETDGLTAQVRVHRELVDNRARGISEPPPMWTNAITEDAVLGQRPATFLVDAPPGDYTIYVLCGTSEGGQRSQYFDFTIESGKEQRRVQIEGAYLFRPVRWRVTKGVEPLTIRFAPRSRFVVNAVIAWTDDEADRIEREVIAPLEEWTFRMPPEEWARWKEDPVPVEPPMPPLSAEAQERGFIVFSRPSFETVYPHTVPAAADLDPELRVFATPGEYATTNVIVRPQRRLREATVRVEGLAPLSPDDVQVRRVAYARARPNYTVLYRYRWVPDALEIATTADLPADENTRFWITLRVPPEAPAGVHRGVVEVRTGLTTVRVPLVLRVLPFRLRDDPSRIFGIYYRHPYDLMAAASDPVSREYFRRKAELEHADLAAHGTRNIVLSLSTRPADADGRFRFNWDLLQAKLELAAKHGFVGPVVMGIPTERIYEKYVGARPGAHLRGVKDPPEAFEREMTALVAAVEEERRRRGWPEFLYYPVDEPGTDAAAVRFMVKALRACQAAGGRTYLTADPTLDAFEPLRPHVDVWCTQAFAPEREVVAADARSRGVEYWCYPNHVNGENDHTPAVGARMTYGFGFWRSGFRALIPWIYQSSTGDPFNYLDGATMDFFNRSEPDGRPRAVILWEAYREGYNDYRYVHTLESLLAEARADDRPGVKAAVARAQEELATLERAIRVQPKYKDSGLWDAADFDVRLWMIAQAILALQQAMTANATPGTTGGVRP